MQIQSFLYLMIVFSVSMIFDFGSILLTVSFRIVREGLERVWGSCSAMFNCMETFPRGTTLVTTFIREFAVIRIVGDSGERKFMLFAQVTPAIPPPMITNVDSIVEKKLSVN